jgi:flagellar hook-length control protein FliK
VGKDPLPPSGDLTAQVTDKVEQAIQSQKQPHHPIPSVSTTIDTDAMNDSVKSILNSKSGNEEGIGHVGITGKSSNSKMDQGFSEEERGSVFRHEKEGERPTERLDALRGELKNQSLFENTSIEKNNELRSDAKRTRTAQDRFAKGSANVNLSESKDIAGLQVDPNNSDPFRKLGDMTKESGDLKKTGPDQQNLFVPVDKESADGNSSKSDLSNSTAQGQRNGKTAGSEPQTPFVTVGDETTGKTDAGSNRFNSTAQDTERSVPLEPSVQMATKPSSGHAITFAKLETPLTLGEQHSIMEQIVDKASLRMFHNHSKLQLRLKPEFLGDVRMTVATKNDQVTVRIITDQAFVKETIESNLQQLKVELQNNGLSIDKFEVIVNPDAEQQGGRDQFSQLFKEQHSHNSRQQADEGNPDNGEKQRGKDTQKDESQRKPPRKGKKQDGRVDQFV